MPKVYIDLGHYKSDSGAVGNGLKEVDINISYGRYCIAELKRHNIEVKEGQGGSLDTRCLESNKWGADIFVSKHINAGGGDGFEVYYHPTSSKGQTFANNVYNQVVNVDKLNNGRGVKTANFAVLRGTNCPAILIECAFIDTNDIQCIDEEHEQKAFGISIAKGILKQLGIEYKSEQQQDNYIKNGYFYANKKTMVYAETGLNIEVGYLVAGQNAKIIQTVSGRVAVTYELTNGDWIIGYVRT